MAADVFEAGLEAAVKEYISGASGIVDLHRLSAGASQETWSFDALIGGSVEPLILRRPPGGKPESRSAAIGQETEAKLIQIAYEHGVKAPRVSFVLTPEDGIGVGFVMARIEGETLAPHILRDELFAEIRPQLAGQCGEILASIHAIPLADVSFLPERTPVGEWEGVRTTYERYFESPSPVFEYALRWVKERINDDGARSFVHGDFRNGNLIFGPEGVRAVLDWEVSHIGEPMEDLAWICVNSWRFGRIDKPVGGFGEREQLFEGYEKAGGVKVDPERVRFWEVFGSLRWGVSCRGMAFTHLTGHDRSVERAAIGRRSSECEADLMILLGE